jgi:hypothetical protein
MAGTFSRHLHAFCTKQGIPIIEAGSGQRKHELAEPHVPKDPTLTGLFLVITSGDCANLARDGSTRPASALCSPMRNRSASDGGADSHVNLGDMTAVEPLRHLTDGGVKRAGVLRDGVFKSDVMGADHHFDRPAYLAGMWSCKGDAVG